MYKQILKCLREYKKPTFLTVLFIVGEAVIEALIPFITAKLVDQIKLGTDMANVLRTGLLLTVMAAISLCCGGIAGFTCSKASAGLAKNIRNDAFDKIQSYSFENIDKFSTASIVTRLTMDITDIQMAYMMIIRTAVRAPLMLLFSIIMATIMGGKLALTFVVIVPVLGFGLFIVSQKAMPAFRRVFVKYDKLNESIEENVRAMRVVKGFAREEYEKEKFGKASEEIRKEFTSAERIVALNSPIMQFCIYFNMIFIMIVGSMLIVKSGGTTLDVGEMSAMLTYGFQTLMQLMMLSVVYVMLTISAEAINRLGEVLAEEPVLKNCENPVFEIQDGSVDFENVGFKYSVKARKYSLDEINLHITAGMTVGIIGGIGSGKSSLVQLIPRLYDATEGVVKVGGVDVKRYDMQSLRNSVAMVLQKNLLFSGTIAENLRWGNENATDDEIKEACRLAQADDFIESFPEKYETVIEQGGTNISGGQKQRICIARALLKKPKILILDDSTSAVDTKTDALIRAGFKRYIPETTKFIIAQRLSSVMDADLIIVLDNGKIAASGKHNELVKSCDIYREVWKQQIQGGALDEE